MKKQTIYQESQERIDEMESAEGGSAWFGLTGSRNTGMIKIKRIYDEASTSDGYRIFIDRLWPRGLSKSKAKFDLWMKEIAPSDALRKWFSHDPRKWTELKKRYAHELKEKEEELEKIRKILREHKTVTLVYGARDEEHNNAVALRELLSRERARV